MLKDFLLVRAAPALSFKYLQDYLQFKHAPLALTVPTTTREMIRYTMNHIVEAAGRDCRVHAPMGGLASIVEHEIGGLEGITRITADPRYIADVHPDEEFMIENLMDGAPLFVAIDEEVIVLEASSPGSSRMFDFVRRPKRMSRGDFLARLEEDGIWARAQPSYRDGAAKRIHSLAGASSAPFGINAEPFDAVIEVWISKTAKLAGLMKEQRERRMAFCDSSRSFSVITEEQRIRG